MRIKVIDFVLPHLSQKRLTAHSLGYVRIKTGSHIHHIDEEHLADVASANHQIINCRSRRARDRGITDYHDIYGAALMLVGRASGLACAELALQG